MRLRITLLALLAVALVPPTASAARDRASVGTKPENARKSGRSFLEKPIEPAPEREEKPRAGWGGFYGGLNGGSSSGDR